MLSTIFVILAEGDTVNPVAVNVNEVAWTLITFVTLLIVLWKFAWKTIATKLDERADKIEGDLAEARKLREEAEALKAEYQKKAAAAEKDAKAIVARAEEEADSIVAKAAVDAKEMVARKKAMAEAKIAAEQRQAVDELKALAANAAAASAAKIIADKGDADADAKMIDEAIARTAIKSDEINRTAVFWNIRDIGDAAEIDNANRSAGRLSR